MIQYVVAYISTTVVFFAIDFVWLNYLAKDLYQDKIGHLLASSFNIPAAVGFYLLFIIGIVIFAIAPALQSGEWKTALVYGILFGFFTYATYDLTNLATLRDWPLSIVIIDLLWGMFITGASATLGYLLTKIIL